MEDQKGQKFIIFEGVKITAVKRTYSGDPGISIRAFHEDPSISKRTHMGPEIPIPDRETAMDFIAAILNALLLVDF